MAFEHIMALKQREREQSVTINPQKSAAVNNMYVSSICLISRQLVLPQEFVANYLLDRSVLVNI